MLSEAKAAHKATTERATLTIISGRGRHMTSALMLAECVCVCEV